MNLSLLDLIAIVVGLVLLGIGIFGHGSHQLLVVGFIVTAVGAGLAIVGRYDGVRRGV